MANGTARREYGSGSISQRKDNSWTARIKIGYSDDGKPIMKAFYGKSEREVRKKLNAFKAELAKGDYTVVRKSDVKSYMTDWLQNTKRNKLKPKSYDRLESTLKYQVFPYIGDIQLAALNADDIQHMINSLKDVDGLAYSTIKKAYDAVNDCFSTGLIKRTVRVNPALGVELPVQKQFPSKRIKYYTKDEVRELYKASLATYGNGKRIYPLGDAVISPSPGDAKEANQTHKYSSSGCYSPVQRAWQRRF